MLTHESIKDSPAKKVLHCKKCDYETNKNSNLKRHMLTHKTNIGSPTTAKINVKWPFFDSQPPTE